VRDEGRHQDEGGGQDRQRHELPDSASRCHQTLDGLAALNVTKGKVPLNTVAF